MPCGSSCYLHVKLGALTEECAISELFLRCGQHAAGIQTLERIGFMARESAYKRCAPVEADFMGCVVYKHWKRIYGLGDD